MNQIGWFERQFEFPGNQNIFPSLLERLEGTSIRLRVKTLKISDSIQVIRPEGKWSIMENIRHLLEMELVWQKFISSILKGKRIINLSNTKSPASPQLNNENVDHLLIQFADQRRITLETISKLKNDKIFKNAFYTPLQRPLSILDLAYYMAEHDDHHLARITNIHQTISLPTES
ncbi:DinB family protein [Flexithrix dorotheae]|uniref:DinB family protein n=1 Tax=Flexithrix dorotheae TaxID=70993 RepID=UPI000360CBA2|nr:DinB family protein [Flexithrix dorotheae]